MTNNLRFTATLILKEILTGRSLTTSLETHLAPIHDARDRAFIQTLCYGVCRFYPRLIFLLEQLLEKPIKEKDKDIYALLLIGLYQLTELNIVPHAAVSETVAAAPLLKKSWARGLINAVLRNYLRRTKELNEKILTSQEAKFSHPAWLLNAIQTAWGEKANAIFETNNAHPPFALRINLNKISREQYLQDLIQKNIEATLIAETSAGIILETPLPVSELPGFSEAKVSVQDGAAQLATEWLSLKNAKRLLDACAAPGGKLAHALEIAPQLEAIAIEKEATRTRKITETLKRLQLSASCITADASEIHTWWDGKLFDRILLDAPCSASGVIRRHPDIKILRKKSDIATLATLQQKLLTALWPLLEKNGFLLYVTCSLFPEENSENIATFLATHPDAVEEKLPSSLGIPCEHGLQILPGMHAMDGFYYAKLKKI